MKEPTNHLRLGEPEAGVSLDDAIVHTLAILELVHRRFTRTGPISAEFEFNGTQALVWVGEDVEYVRKRYNMARTIQQQRAGVPA